jgi:hypothetical protein
MKINLKAPGPAVKRCPKNLLMKGIDISSAGNASAAIGKAKLPCGASQGEGGEQKGRAGASREEGGEQKGHAGAFREEGREQKGSARASQREGGKQKCPAGASFAFDPGLPLQKRLINHQFHISMRPRAQRLV